MRYSLSLMVGLLLPAAAAAQPQPLRLTAALAEADRRAFANQGAQATAAMAHASARQPLRGLLPSARLEAGAMRSTDPIGVFGTLMRQRRVTPDAFAPDRLNRPAAIDNLQGAAVLEVPLVNGDALLGHRAASRAAEAARAGAQWTGAAVRLTVVRGYYGAVLAAEKHATLLRAVAAAEAMTAQVDQLLRQGLVTRADLLQAQVRTHDLKAQALAADAEAIAAREQLGFLLGRSSAADAPAREALPATLPSDSLVRLLLTQTADTALPADITQRDDLRAARLGTSAAHVDLLRARSTLLPRLNGVARYDWNAPGGLYTGRPSWTVGVMASWSLFGGGGELADVSGGRARLSAARSAEQAAVADARLEHDAAARRMQVTRMQLDLARLAVDQSREAHRLVQRRYAGGLATMAELLAADATRTASELAFAAARHAVIDAVAQFRLGRGDDPGTIAAVLDSPSEY